VTSTKHHVYKPKCVFSHQKQNKNEQKKTTKNVGSQIMTFPGFGLILGGQKSSKIEIFSKHEKHKKTWQAQQI